MKTTAFALMFALVTVGAVQAQTPPPVDPEQIKELSQETYRVYKKSKHAGVLALERTCWKSAKKSEAVSASLKCGTFLLAGGVIDQAMQREEMRGAMPDFGPNDQRKRFLAQTKMLGMSEEQANSSLQALVGNMDSVLAGLMQAGMR